MFCTRGKPIAKVFVAMWAGLVIFLVGASPPASAREYLTFDLAQERLAWRLSRCPDYASKQASARASYLLPDHPEYGEKHLVPAVLDGDVETRTSQNWPATSSGRYWLVIELAEPRQISAFSWQTETVHSLHRMLHWHYVPDGYEIRVSVDGEQWTTVAEHRGPRAYGTMYTFEPVVAKYVAMAEMLPSRLRGGKTIP